LRECWDLDRDPLSALRRGDTRTFEAFVLCETRTFLAFFMRLGASQSEAEDLVQDLFLKLFSQAHHYQPRERFAAFAFRVARNAWIDRTRRLRRDREPPREFAEGEHESATAAVEPLESLTRREETQRLDLALHALSGEHRMVLELGVLQELSYSEIAGLLGIPLGTVKSRMFYAVRRLRQAFGTAPDEALGGA
jgi:RNA polymerase sigma-70 factor (ECF subfamily)